MSFDLQALNKGNCGECQNYLTGATKKSKLTYKILKLILQNAKGCDIIQTQKIKSDLEATYDQRTEN
jgi:hypothetical protein